MFSFDALFSSITRSLRPYPWQRRLYERMLSGSLPGSICVPTGAGKTSVMNVWLLALAAGAPVPRRLLWVVDRRVVVDQATEEANRIAARVREIEELPVDVRRLAVSTLRGERADNGEWSEDPSRPAIIVGTVDMVGSRLLFSGYGDGKWKRPQHAGLLGTDTLAVNDEAHLTPAFAKLLCEVRALRPLEARFHVLLLSATPSGGGERWPESLEEDLRENPEFAKRFRARKELRLVESKGKIDDDIVKLACGEASEAGPRRLVFVQSPERAAAIARSIEKKTGSGRVLLLTGTMRGHERDGLTRHEVFADFQAREGGAPCWLVATSAAEVGIDITSDVLITELDTADHLVQRFGRLNRFGGSAGLAIVVFRPPSDKEPRKKACLDYLRSLADVTCETMFAQPAPGDASQAAPVLARFEERLAELWAMTSVDSPAKPPVEPWLHGKQEEYPETEAAWREDVPWLTREGVALDEVREVLRRHRVLAHEKLKEPTRRLAEKLAALPEETRAILVTAGGELRVGPLRELQDALPYGLLVLPAGVGRLSRGMLCGPDEGEPAGDVADAGGERRRHRHYVTAGGEARRLGGGEAAIEPKAWELKVPAEGGDEESEPEGTLLYWTEKAAQLSNSEAVTLAQHSASVASEAAKLATGLGFDASMTAAFEWAGRLHDLGKGRALWQAAAGAEAGCELLAKPKGHMRPAALGGYRHELGSLLDAAGRELPEETRDLILHLIASHHGWARPHFPPRAFDKSAVRRSREECEETVRRFGRLQSRYGPWGLAYLEAVFRAADARVSRQEASAEEQPEYA